MPSTLCIYIRADDLSLVALDPECPAPSHAWDLSERSD